MYKHYREPSDTQLVKDILEQYRKYGYLQSNFLCQLLDGKVGSKYIVRKQKAMREKYGLIFRPREQHNCKNSEYAFYIHALTERGKDLAKELDVNPPIVASITRRDPEEARGESSVEDVETRNFWHAMGIINTLASVEIGAREHGITFISEGEIRERCRQKYGREIDFDLSFKTSYKGEPFEGKRKCDFLFGLTSTIHLAASLAGMFLMNSTSLITSPPIPFPNENHTPLLGVITKARLSPSPDGHGPLSWFLLCFVNSKPNLTATSSIG